MKLFIQITWRDSIFIFVRERKKYISTCTLYFSTRNSFAQSRGTKIGREGQEIPNYLCRAVAYSWGRIINARASFNCVHPRRGEKKILNLEDVFFWIVFRARSLLNLYIYLHKIDIMKMKNALTCISEIRRAADGQWNTWLDVGWKYASTDFSFPLLLFRKMARAKLRDEVICDPSSRAIQHNWRLTHTDAPYSEACDAWNVVERHHSDSTIGTRPLRRGWGEYLRGENSWITRPLFLLSQISCN